MSCLKMFGAAFACALASCFAIFVASSLLAGCGAPTNTMGNGDDALKANASTDASAPSSANASGTMDGLPCDVDAVLKAHCQACHGASPSAGASTSLTSFDDLQADHGGRKLYELVKDRIHSTDQPMPPNPPLDAADVLVLDNWIDGGAKGSNVTCDNTNAASGDVEPFTCDGDLTTLRSTTPFVMTADAALDQYVCFGFDVERTTKHHVVGFSPSVDNKDILHHILVFQAPNAVSPEVAPCDPAQAATWTMMGGWAPGAKNRYMPPEAGLPEEAGTTHYVVQLHYNNARALTGAKDQSGYSLCSTDKLRPNDADIIAFGAMNVGPKQPIQIPPRSTSYTVTCKYPWIHGDVTFFNASPHMHRRGRALKSETTDGVMLADQENFDFDAQVGFPVTTAVHRGDTVKTTCTWTNPDDKLVTFGEGTEDEMCFNFLAYYPKQASILSWAEPTLLATCE